MSKIGQQHRYIKTATTTSNRGRSGLGHKNHNDDRLQAITGVLQCFDKSGKPETQGSFLVLAYCTLPRCGLGTLH